MSKDKHRITRKRFVKLLAGTKGLQVQEGWTDGVHLQPV